MGLDLPFETIMIAELVKLYNLEKEVVKQP
jgi:hypothetical protein